MRSRLLLFALLVIALASSACSATIRRHGLREVDGVIHSSDPEGVNVQLDERLYRVPGEQISEIDHPGNGWLLVGGIAFGFSATMVGMAMSFGSGNTATPTIMGAAMMYAAIGAVMAVAGGLPWAMSKSAASGFEERTPGPDSLLPLDDSRGDKARR